VPAGRPDRQCEDRDDREPDERRPRRDRRTARQDEVGDQHRARDEDGRDDGPDRYDVARHRTLLPGAVAGS
jgi:hypothetical protein